MKKLFIILPLLALLYSCDKETDMHPGNQSDKVVFVASIPQTKTVLGEKDGSSWPLLWSAGDAISVNGVETQG